MTITGTSSVDIDSRSTSINSQLAKTSPENYQKSCWRTAEAREKQLHREFDIKLKWFDSNIWLQWIKIVKSILKTKQSSHKKVVVCERVEQSLFISLINFSFCSVVEEETSRTAISVLFFIAIRHIWRYKNHQQQWIFFSCCSSAPHPRIKMK